MRIKIEIDLKWIWFEMEYFGINDIKTGAKMRF